MMGIEVRLTAKLTLVAVLAAGSLWGCPAARAAEASDAGAVYQAHSQPGKGCPAPDRVEAVLAQASESLGSQRFQEAATLLQPLATRKCDPRISLLLAAAFEGQNDPSQATAELQRAHSVWPSNDSIAASLARSYLSAGDTGKAARALAQFHADAKTPEQEMRMAVVVYLAAHQLLSAETVAAAAYKNYPSVQTLLLLANTLQMQGRYPDVNRLLGSQRAAYAGSPEFFVTLAESEFDASTYQAARDDLKRAWSRETRLDRQNKGFDTPTPQISGKHAPGFDLRCCCGRNRTRPANNKLSPRRWPWMNGMGPRSARWAGFCSRIITRLRRLII